jgi:hypothetical protein
MKFVQIRNFDLPRETGDFHHTHGLSLGSAPPLAARIRCQLSRDYSSFLTDLAGASVRLVSSIDRAGQAMRVG